MCRFIKYHQDCNQDVSDLFIYIFRDVNRTPLKHVSLRNCTITDDGMKMLLQHNLVSLTMWYCDRITYQSWQTLIEHAGKLKILELGRYVDILHSSPPFEKVPLDFELKLPHLKKLRLNSVVLKPTLKFRYTRSHFKCSMCTCNESFDF